MKKSQTAFAFFFHKIIFFGKFSFQQEMFGWNNFLLVRGNWIVFVVIFINKFLKHRPSEPMLSISRNVRVCVCVSVCVHFFRYRLTVFFPPLPKVGCTKFSEIRNPLGKVLKEVVSDLNIFAPKLCKIAAVKFFFSSWLKKMVHFWGIV